jgi:hypothetical protein
MLAFNIPVHEAKIKLHLFAQKTADGRKSVKDRVQNINSVK